MYPGCPPDESKGSDTRLHGAKLCAILHAMAKLHRASTPEIVACNIAEVESPSISATLQATTFIVV